MEIPKPHRSTVAGDPWREDLATKLGVETMYSRRVWLDALGIIETWDNRDEVADILLRTSMWLYPPSFARQIAHHRGSF